MMILMLMTMMMMLMLMLLLLLLLMMMMMMTILKTSEPIPVQGIHSGTHSSACSCARALRIGPTSDAKVSPPSPFPHPSNIGDETKLCYLGLAPHPD